MKEKTAPTFTSNSITGFSNELKSRIQSYFKQNDLSRRNSGWRAHTKSIIWLSVYFASFVILLTGLLNFWWSIALFIGMGLAMTGVGLNTMHSANHGTYSKNPRLNKIAGATLCLFGGNPFFWRLQHNVLHHTYTNIHANDEDIAAGSLLRFSRNDKKRWFHKYQQFYFPFLYSLLTLVWAFHKDFEQLGRYNKMGLITQHKSSFAKQLTNTTAIKLGYAGYMVVLPMLISGMFWWQWLIGFLIMHFTAGLILSLVFQSAHVVEETEFPEPENGEMQDEWMVHQLKTTSNFATKNRLFSWYAGGLNFQIEHHLFPSIGDNHLRNISKIVKQCAKDFNVPYNETPSFLGAIASHVKLLKNLGTAN